MYRITNPTPERQKHAVFGDRLPDLSGPRRELYEEVLYPLRAILRKLAGRTYDEWGAFSPALLEVYLADLLVEGMAHLRNCIAGETELRHTPVGVAATLGLDLETYRDEVGEALVFAKARWRADGQRIVVPVTTSLWPFALRPGGGMG